MIVETLKLKGLGKLAASILAMVFITISAGAQHPVEDGHSAKEEAQHPEEISKEFNASEMIMHHVSDAHEIHFMGEGENSIAIYLPVILNTNDGWKFFSSSPYCISLRRSTIGR